jgi:hypothetical protein
VKAEHLELSKLKKAELYDFMKGTRDKEEYRRASAIKQKYFAAIKLQAK